MLIMQQRSRCLGQPLRPLDVGCEGFDNPFGAIRFALRPTCWYNHVRPHQYLNECTPAEAWSNIDIYTKPIKDKTWFDAWDGLLTGFYLRR